jgi:hypothetical protein
LASAAIRLSHDPPSTDPPGASLRAGFSLPER